MSLEEDGSGFNLTGDDKDRLDKGMTWRKSLQTFGEGVIEGDSEKVFGKIKEVLGDLVTKDKIRGCIKA